MTRFLELIDEKVVLFDGAAGTEVQKQNPTDDDFEGKVGCIDYLCVTRPDMIRGIHESYLAAGADVITTCTFGSTRPKLEEYGLGDRLGDINRAAVLLAREAADTFSRDTGIPRFVAGDMGPSGFLPSSNDPDLGGITFDELRVIYKEQADHLIDSGVDLLLIETTQDLLEARATIRGIHDAFAEKGVRLPIQAQVTLDVTGRMLLGTDITGAMVVLEALGVDAIGLNCSTGPDEMVDSIRFLAENCTAKVSCIPNAGLPINSEGEASYPLGAEAFADALATFVRDFGIEIVGGCCGTTPEHIQTLAARLASIKRKRRTVTRWHAVSSSMKGVALRQEPAPLIVGERLNAQGSRKTKRLLLADDYDGLMQLAREQVESGAHVLDVCLATNERDDEVAISKTLAKLLAMSVEAPMMIDSTDPLVIEAALKAYPGRAIVNSINMENGLERIEAVMPHVATHGAAVVALTIDENGMAKTVEHKIEVAKTIFDIVSRDYGVHPNDLIFDTLTFTLATGEAEFRDSAVATLKAITEVKKQIPGVLTILGVSNVSFGLSRPARRVINSIFLYRAVEAGLDLAIVNAAEITPYPSIPTEERDLCEDLIYNRRDDALQRVIEYFEGKEELPPEVQNEELDNMPPAERIHFDIVNRKGDGIEEAIDAELTHRGPVDLLNNVLLPAMKEVGDKFGSGELILPFVLQSAEVMKRAVSHLEQFLDKKDDTSKGTVVLATVFGDVHDIGKNLVKTILSNNGYTVIDLGKQVPAGTIINKAQEIGADAIGLSALLVSTSKQMPIIVEELRKRKMNVPVMIGGAAITRDFGYRTLYAGSSPPAQGADSQKATAYEPGVFYCKDAFEGLDAMEALIHSERRGPFVEGITAKAETAMRRIAISEAKRTAALQENAIRRERTRSVAIPTPPFFGARAMTDIDLTEIFPLLDINELFRLSWGAKGTKGEAFDKLTREEFKPRLRSLKTECIQSAILRPTAVYGYFRCKADGNRLLIFDADDPTRMLGQFDFARQTGDPHLCLADYFSEYKPDVIALQVVTIGTEADRVCEALNAANDYTQAYYLHGLAVQTAEALAEWIHRRVRKELGLEVHQGKRYSPGYSACPELADHETIFRLLDAQRAIGVDLTVAHQIIPEQSTAAFVIHHEDAAYFNVH